MSPACPSCGAPRSGTYCSACGERVLDRRDLSSRRLLASFFGNLFNLEGRFLKSFWRVASRPGRLALDWSNGVRKPVMGPAQLLILGSLLYFLLQPFTPANTLNTRLEGHMHRQLYSDWVVELVEARIDERVAAEPVEEDPASLRERVERDYLVELDGVQAAYSRAFSFLLVPVYALLFGLLQAGSKRYLSEHLVFATHFTVFFLVHVLLFAVTALVILIVLTSNALTGIRDAWQPARDLLLRRSETLIGIGMGLAIWRWLFSGFRTYYANGRGGALLRGLVGAVLVFFFLPVYRFLMFLVTYVAVG